ncbi:hypothetical protein SLE2022_269090 [Rubroshorea leprosula]
MIWLWNRMVLVSVLHPSPCSTVFLLSHVCLIVQFPSRICVSFDVVLCNNSLFWKSLSQRRQGESRPCCLCNCCNGMFCWVADNYSFSPILDLVITDQLRAPNTSIHFKERNFLQIASTSSSKCYGTGSNRGNKFCCNNSGCGITFLPLLLGISMK